MITLPEFLFVPFVSPKYPTDKFIISTKYALVWRVIEFPSTIDRDVWVLDNDAWLKDSGVYYISIHKKYPYVLLCSGALAKAEINIERLGTLSNRASDWYAEHYLRSKALLQGPKDETGFTAFYIAENRTEHPGEECIIKLSYPRVLIRYKLSEAYFSSYDQFFQSIAHIEWLDGERPQSQEEIDDIFTDCWNFLALEERKLQEDLDEEEEDYGDEEEEDYG